MTDYLYVIIIGFVVLLLVALVVSIVASWDQNSQKLKAELPNFPQNKKLLKSVKNKES